LICAVCRKQPAQIGVLCDDCRDELEAGGTISPEQVESKTSAPTAAVLIGPWGQPHRLDAHMVIGRNIDDTGLAILEASVSRRHAELRHAGAEWTLVDHGTANGTYVDDRRITEPTTLHDRARIRFGAIAFYFIADAPDLVAPPRSRRIGETQPIARDATTLELSTVPMPAATFVFLEPTGGGGGVIEIDGKQVQLTIPQLELVRLLVDRMLAQADVPEVDRGFVQASELMKLSLDAPEPGVDHVRQLVRRVRRALVKADIGDLIESRHGLGYRLRVAPRVE
jgi:hypothetical protein